MRHQIVSDDLRAPEMAEAVEKCVHCGFCLAACPTYNLLGEEMDSPRGRIYLMKNVLEENLPAAEAQPYIDRCLGCMACVPACPSGVEYGDLLVGYRALQEKERQRAPMDALTRKLICETLPYPTRFRLAALTGKLGKALLPALPEAFAAMLSLLPDKLPPALPSAAATAGARRAARQGCLAAWAACSMCWRRRLTTRRRRFWRATASRCISRASKAAAARSCCTWARRSARATSPAATSAPFPDDVDAIITTAAGCGSGMKDYELLFKGQADAAQAAQFSQKVMDFSAYLAGLGLRETTGFSSERRVVYQDACHLLHAQGHGSEPRALLAGIPNCAWWKLPMPACAVARPAPITLISRRSLPSWRGARSSRSWLPSRTWSFQAISAVLRNCVGNSRDRIRRCPFGILPKY